MNCIYYSFMGMWLDEEDDDDDDVCKAKPTHSEENNMMMDVVTLQDEGAGGTGDTYIGLDCTGHDITGQARRRTKTTAHIQLMTGGGWRR